MNRRSIRDLASRLAAWGLSPRFLRFLVVGVLNTAVGYGLFAAVYLATGRHRVAIVIATVLGVVFNFFSTGRLVFGSRRLRAFVPFVLGYVVTCGLNILLVDGLLLAGVSPVLGQLVALPPVVLLSYQINHRLVFRTARRGASPP